MSRGHSRQHAGVLTEAERDDLVVLISPGLIVVAVALAYHGISVR